MISFTCPVSAQEEDTWASPAQCSESKICGASPELLTLANDFSNEIINSIKTVGTEPPYVWKYVTPSRFESWQFKAPKRWIISKALDRSQEALGSVLSIGRIFTIVRMPRRSAADVMGSLIVLGKNQIFTRDENKLNKTEISINDKKFELSAWWWRTDEIKEKNLETMQNIFKKYQDKWLFLVWEIRPWVQYNHIIMALTQINKSLKYMVAMPSTDLVSKNFNYGWYIQIKFNPAKITAAKIDYECAQWIFGKCDTAVKNLKSARAKIKSWVAQWGKNAAKEFSDANKRLQQAFSPNPTTKDEKETLTKEQELLQTIYWLKAAKMMSWWFLWAKNRRSQIANQYAGIKDSLKTAKNEITELNTPSWETKIQPPKEPVINDVQQSFIDGMVSNTNWLLEKAKDDRSMSDITNNTDITVYFVQLSAKLNEIKNTIIGDKEKENTLIKNLWELCQNQCSDIPVKTCYY